MAELIQILTLERDGEDGLRVTFSDGTTAGYVTEELLELRPHREPVNQFPDGAPRAWRSVTLRVFKCRLNTVCGLVVLPAAKHLSPRPSPEPTSRVSCFIQNQELAARKVLQRSDRCVVHNANRATAGNFLLRWMIHYGRLDGAIPDLFTFPTARVCFECGCSTFTLAQTELLKLKEAYMNNGVH